MEVIPAAPNGVGRFSFPPELLWKYQMQLQPVIDFRTQMPRTLGNDPRQWSRESVAAFLQWCHYEFDLPQFNMEKFQMNGKALCLLTKADLAERSPGSGDVLHNVLQMLMKCSTEQQHSPLTPQFSPHAWPPLLAPGQAPSPNGHHPGIRFPPPVSFSVTLSPVPSSKLATSSGTAKSSNSTLKPTSAVSVPRVTLSPAPPTSPGSHDNHTHYSHSNLRSDQETQCQPYSPLEQNHSLQPQMPGSPSFHKSELSPTSANVMPSINTPPHSPNHKISQFNLTEHTTEPNSNGRLLWDFLQQLLNDSQQRYTAFIAWKNRESGVFKIVDPPGLAKLWGIQKNHLSMNYDKMSRALRYYYRVNILRKVQGERHCYQFLRNPSELRSIKNMSLLRQQTQPFQPPSLYVKSEPQENVDCEDIQPTDLSISSSSFITHGHSNSNSNNNNTWTQENVKSEHIESNNNNNNINSNNNNNNNNNNNTENGKGQDMKLQLNMWTQENDTIKLESPTNGNSMIAIKTEDSS